MSMNEYVILSCASAPSLGIACASLTSHLHSSDMRFYRVRVNVREGVHGHRVRGLFPRSQWGLKMGRQHVIAVYAYISLFQHGSSKYVLFSSVLLLMF
jgi:hypothetical protein